VKKRTQIWSHLSFLAVARIGMVFVHVISEVKTLLNFGCIDGSQSLKRSRIVKVEKFSDLHPDSKILEHSPSQM